MTKSYLDGGGRITQRPGEEPEIVYYEPYTEDEMTDARIKFEEDEKGRVRPIVIGGNGEEQAKLEWYDNQSNATRGVTDLFNTLASIMSTVREDGDKGEGYPELDESAA